MAREDGRQEKKDKKDKVIKHGKLKERGDPQAEVGSVRSGKDKGDTKDTKDTKDKGDKKKDKKDKKGKKDKKDKKGKTIKHHHKHKESSGAKIHKGKAAAAKSKAPQGKVLLKGEDDYEPVYRWWDREDGALSGKRGAKKWSTFEHHGLMFAPEYVPHGIPIKYDGVELKLSPGAEEIATYFIQAFGTTYENKELFRANFWSIFSAALPKDTVIKELDKCDFSVIHAHRVEQRQARLDKSKEEKEAAAREMNEKKSWFTHALVDGIRERLGAVCMEPPQLFRGRGEHPKQGFLKPRMFPEVCTLNIGEDAVVPKVVNVPGHAWKDVMHESTVQWIASYEDVLLQETKYTSFAATSSLKGQPDLLKYDRARNLLKCVDVIRADYEKLQLSKKLADRQKGVAIYFIDKLALRVGGDKDTEEEADTVGCCSLRVEHLTLEMPNFIHFDFLGKDSIRYQNRVAVTDLVFSCVEQFIRGKQPQDDVFDVVNPTALNDYFKNYMDDLTAKVFRTFNASHTLQEELTKFDFSKINQYEQDQLVSFYNTANREVAILCNHQKAESKGHSAAMEKMTKAKEILDKNLRTLKKHLVMLEAGKAHIGKDSKLPRDANSCKKRIAEIRVRLERQKIALQNREENKTVSLGTSKTSYMDPRITVAWCKKVDLQIERVFPRTTRTKFPWAMHFKSSYCFD